MFDIDRWQEIFDTIQKNKLRTFLTSLSVASGIFILVVLLGFGQGMQNGIQKEFEEDAANRIWIWSSTTTKEHKGLNPGRRIQMRNENFTYINTVFDEDLEYRSPMFNVWNGAVNYKAESGAYQIRGTNGDMQPIEGQSMVLGRYINQSDLDSKSKVAVISNKIERELLKGVEDPLQEYIQISGINFRVVGVYTDRGGERDENKLLIPITTAQSAFNGSDIVANMAFTIEPQESFDKSVDVSNKVREGVLQYLKQAHSVAPDDNRAINVFNALDEAKRFHTLMDNIAFFFWFVGICTIIAGVVGVSNIMLIVVKERTKEIGIRKALGAKPWSIIGMILHESIFVTAFAGFAGLIFSMALLEIVGPNIEVDYVVNPSVNFNIAITMVLLLIVAGALAGFFPAWRASHIKPIEALKDE